MTRLPRARRARLTMFAAIDPKNRIVCAELTAKLMRESFGEARSRSYRGRTVAERMPWELYAALGWRIARVDVVESRRAKP